MNARNDREDAGRKEVVNGEKRRKPNAAVWLNPTAPTPALQVKGGDCVQDCLGTRSLGGWSQPGCTGFRVAGA